MTDLPQDDAVSPAPGERAAEPVAEPATEVSDAPVAAAEGAR